jgi:spore coat polysaccharide biosynthesis protein SpsF
MSANVVAIVQTRMGSTRLPGKVLLPIVGEPMLAHVVERARAVPGIGEVVVATSTEAADDRIAELCAARDWACFRGSEEDVLDRYYQAALAYKADHVLRVTADCPLLEIEQTGAVVERHLESGADYTHNITVWGSGMPLGTGAEIFTLTCLETSWRDGREPHHREHVDEYVGDHPELFRMERVDAPEALRRPELRLTVDTPDDLALVRAVYDRFPSGTLPAVAEVIALLDENPELTELNRHVVQKPI